MGRRALFRPRIATEEDRIVFDRLVQTFAAPANAETRKRVVADFASFGATNGVSDRPCLCLKLWLGACHRDGLAWGTVDTYSAYITKVIYPALSWNDRHEWQLIRGVTRAAHADSDTKGACTIPREHLIQVLGSPLLTLRVRQAIAAITFTGCRLADVRRWRRRQFRFGRRGLRVEVRLSKNRRRRSKRRHLRVHDCERLLGITMDQSLWSLNGGDPDERPLGKVTVELVNGLLARVCASLHLPRYTTYSFRKYFIQKVIAYHDYDWPRILDLTLHTRMDVVAAHYDGILDEDEDSVSQ